MEFELNEDRSLLSQTLSRYLADNYDIEKRHGCFRQASRRSGTSSHPNRGYGATARRILRAISEGKDWRKVSKNVFDGMGSMGNGASMRVCPIGAYFFDDLKRVKTEAIKSAEITHSNIEGIPGAGAVAVATALATRSKIQRNFFGHKSTRQHERENV